MARLEAIQGKSIARAGATSANLGLFYDIGGVNLDWPSLYGQVEPLPNSSTRTSPNLVELQVTSDITPRGRQRGVSGRKALENYLAVSGISQRVRLTIGDIDRDRGYPSGGTGSSGAESVASVLAGAILFDQYHTPEEIIDLASQGEPGNHLDNVGPAVLGGISMLRASRDGRTRFDKLEVPPTLKLTLGLSSHEKTQGTEGARRALAQPMSREDAIRDILYVRQATSALHEGDVDKLLEVVGNGDIHESPRADAGVYGNFNAAELRELKRQLYDDEGVALVVSGAGPTMLFMHNSEHHSEGMPQSAANTATTWFNEHGIDLQMQPVSVDNEGAYARAQRTNPNSALARGR